jgi:hypothetical protein
VPEPGGFPGRGDGAEDVPLMRRQAPDVTWAIHGTDRGTVRPPCGTRVRVETQQDTPNAGATIAGAGLYFGRRSDLAVAREEALALAETRREVIDELRERLDSLEARHRRAKADCKRRVRELNAALDRTREEARDEAYQTQHLYAIALSDILTELSVDLERIPPDVDAALRHIRKMLPSARPAA